MPPCWEASGKLQVRGWIQNIDYTAWHRRNNNICRVEFTSGSFTESACSQFPWPVDMIKQSYSFTINYFTRSSNPKAMNIMALHYLDSKSELSNISTKNGNDIKKCKKSIKRRNYSASAMRCRSCHLREDFPLKDAVSTNRSIGCFSVWQLQC